MGETMGAKLEGNGAGTPGADLTAIGPDQPGTKRRRGGVAGQDTAGGPRVDQVGGTAQAVAEVQQGGAGGQGV